MRLPRLLLLTVAFLVTLGNPTCRASNPPGRLLELTASVESDVRFRANDHGAQRALRTVYAAHNSPLWVVAGQPSPAALALLRVLEQADAYGLQPQDYDADRVAALAAEGLTPGTAVSTATKEDGEVLFFDDLYGQDHGLERLLGLPPATQDRQLRQLTGSRATGALRVSQAHRVE